MAEYIEREALYQELAELEELARKRVVDTPTNSPAYMRYVTQLNERTSIKHKVYDAPAAYVAPVKHGKWIGKQLDNFRKYEVTCSNCGWVGIENYDSYNEPSDFNYCPNCGAKMDLEG